jgi:hypothetical protein
MWSACPPSRCEGPRRSLRWSGAKLSERSQMAHSETARTVAADARMRRQGGAGDDNGFTPAYSAQCGSLGVDSRQCSCSSQASVSAALAGTLARPGGCFTNLRRSHWSLSKGGFEKAASRRSPEARPAKPWRCQAPQRPSQRAQPRFSQMALCNSLPGKQQRTERWPALSGTGHHRNCHPPSGFFSGLSSRRGGSGGPGCSAQ